MKVTAHHVESLDVFRGISVAAMILVNNPGDWSAVFPSLLHAYWTGWNFADLVFPWFIFAMGVAMPFAFARRRQGHGRAAPLYARVVKRAVLMIALGLLLNAIAAWPSTTPLRFPGVLQRIALAYVIAAPIVLHLRVRTWAAALAALVAAHWALLLWIPFAGYPAGTMTPEHNLARFIDAQVFGPHLLSPTDPEGLLGTLPTTATALLGALAGQVLRTSENARVRLRWLMVGGAASLAAGLAWSAVFPTSKPLWTGSFAFVAGGLGMLLLAVLYVIVDACGVRRWARPFVWLGVNPLAIYFLSEVVGHLSTAPKAWLFWNVLEPAMPRAPNVASAVFGLAYAAAWMAVAGVLYRRGIRIQV